MKTDRELLSRLGLGYDPDPNYERLQKAILRQGLPDRAPLFELAIDDELFSAILGETVGRSGYMKKEEGQRVAHWQNPEEAQRYVEQVIRAYYHLGYDFVILPMHLPVARPFVMTRDTAVLSRESGRGWVDHSRGLITKWEDMERFDWEQLAHPDFTALEHAAKVLPDGMALLTRTQGVMDALMRLMGFDALFYSLADDPRLVEAVSNKAGTLLFNLLSQVVELDGLKAICYADDMGFKTGTLISPQHLRRYVLPWMKKYIDLAHAHGIAFVLHSCGNVEKLMDEMIGMGIDAKHSYEDVIIPIATAKAKYGDRIGILGGLDMNRLASSTEDQVRATVRQAIADCAPGGGFALGSGNSIANYVPLGNFLAMVDETRKVGSYA